MQELDGQSLLPERVQEGFMEEATFDFKERVILLQGEGGCSPLEGIACGKA